MRNIKTVFLMLALIVPFVGTSFSSAQALKPMDLSKKQGKDQKSEAGKKSLSGALEKFTAKYDKNAEFELKYKFKKGDVLRWKVEHTVTTDTNSKKQVVKTASRSLSTMQWRVVNVDSLGQFRIEMSVLDADMWQQTDDKMPITYNSKTHRGKVPDTFQRFAECIGVPFATYKISSNGQIQDKREIYKSIKFGVGSVTMPVPKQPIKIGNAWNAPSSISVSRGDGTHLYVKTRIQYRLQAVENGVAVVSFDTQVLTPVDEPKMRSQLIQQLSKGIIRFDLQKGRMVSKELRWSEKVVGFLGPQSSLNYIAKYNIRLDQNQFVTAKIQRQGINKEGLQKFIRLSEDAPVFRW